MKSFRVTPTDYRDDIFADFGMAREFSKLLATPKQSDQEALRKKRRVGDLEGPIAQPEDRIVSDNSYHIENAPSDQDGPDGSIADGGVNQPHQMDHAYWKRKRDQNRPDRPISKTQEIWVESSKFSAVNDSKHAYKYPSPNTVLELMLKRIRELRVERHGELIQQDSTLSQKLKDSLRKETLATFTNYVDDLERLEEPHLSKA
jgi:hypothetical protein